MNKALLSPSMMCADLVRLENILAQFEKEGVEYLHVDIMDGEFVPNITLGVDFCRLLRRLTFIPLDIHLMIVNPESKLKWFDIRPGELVSVHCESAADIRGCISYVRGIGANAIAAVNPDTPLSVLDGLYDYIDGVLIMSVNPGFAGQRIIPNSFDKVRDLRTRFEKYGIADKIIEVDGNISFENAAKMRDAGADIFVGGTSSVFCGDCIADNIARLRKILK